MPDLAPDLPAAFFPPTSPPAFSRADFGPDFRWGVSAAAYQTEGAWNQHGKGPSIWDEFVQRPGRIRRGETARIACDFYHRWPRDLNLLHQMGIPDFRFSVAWSRVVPNGVGAVNAAGLDFYDRLVDGCLERGITPWLTLYHWDLPAALQQRGGWTNRDVVGWFSDYAQRVAARLGDRVQHWMVLNEPMVFVGAGQLLGLHAPGKRSLGGFLAAIHHAALAQAEGGRALRAALPATAQIGTTFSCSYLTPWRPALPRDVRATRRADALLNRLFLEPALGLGYPVADVPLLSWLYRYHRPGDEDRLPFSFDFLGVQNYTREVVRYSPYVPLAWASLVGAKQRGVPYTQMGWEVYPESLYYMLKQFSAYPNAPRLLITENGAAFPDAAPTAGRIIDPERRAYLRAAIGQVLRARREGVPVEGYFAWSFTDNFEWAEGYEPRFGLVGIDFDTQQRTIKESGRWYQRFLAGEAVGSEQDLGRSRHLAQPTS
ncbi:beta-glucosidase [Hymenobacter daecheongensis DSM 21074]|uniref:Beta-glucosidase n=1 Tax=Hymenobacter daecheongensis DSM 21074 TaxID=1121955 RepID=A0A1M6HS57_9BACT|nr:GH1 family beta-glucosidase [Hymenobacter daecheongensis]SHJ25007.1 beta-glucosidase [Hymenobacter daecheongensis DSM 21074]